MKKIFILDDNEELLDIMQRLLSHEYNVQCQTHAEDIVKEITDFSPDLLLLDHSIGDVNSADILGKLRSTGTHFTTPVVLFSAHPLLSDMANLIGADGYIDKPSDIVHIRKYIKTVLERDRSI